MGEYGLTPDQYRAAAARGQDIVVTAGAGSGKTRTLVARYISLLAEGLSPQRVVAITFTEKAAREMRSRVRSALVQQTTQASTPEARQRWSELESQMDSARIGTIHSLCAEILRSHPAEANLDPRFEVMDEGLAATFRQQAVADTLAWVVETPEMAALLDGLKTNAIQNLLAFLLNRRLEAQAAFEPGLDRSVLLVQAMNDALQKPTLTGPLAALRQMQAEHSLGSDAGESLAGQVEGLLEAWGQAEQALAGGDWLRAGERLFAARRQKMQGATGKRTSQAKGLVAELKAAYDELLDPWLGGKESKSLPPAAEVERLFGQALPLVRLAFERARQAYLDALRQRQSLDFDDLEAGAANLLALPAVRRRWQQEVEALLVDEFQDTNARQRQIVLALCGETPGRLFVVGDARQSIYRFRRADVTVFRQLQQDIRSRGGLVVDLNLTYRAHTPLLQATGDLLRAVMGDQPDPERPYYVPYAALNSDHDLPRPGMLAPHVELILGGGEDSSSARSAAGRALALRLLELHQEGQIQRWDEAALLFRASTGFPAYEDAFEQAGIPFVTIAGQGFYDRPEIRDVLNLVRALADPWDDLAMAGLLRSPAFGLSDTALYQLRWRGQNKIPYWTALEDNRTALDESDQAYARRALDILHELQPLVDRLPVAELLKRLVDRVDYRAILASTGSSGIASSEAGGVASRLWRNLDKLLADAQASGLVNLRSFLEYLDNLRDVGAREGEAPAEAEGAVRLMTIHKAKGLEFPLVILADAARQRRNISEAAYLLPEQGLAFKLDQLEEAPLFYRWARFQDSQQAEAEEKRLLYVALTRAREKLLISGHCTPTQTGWKVSGWLSELLKAGTIDLGQALECGQPCTAVTTSGCPVRVWALPRALPTALLPESGPVQPEQPAAAPDWPISAVEPLYRSLLIPPPEENEIEPSERPRPWRATGPRLRAEAEAVGRLVHRALQHWSFPGEAALPRLLELEALEAGLADPDQRSAAVRLAETLLERLHRHPLKQEIDRALERHHEAPYSRLSARERLDTGYIDLLFRDADGWQIVDFKTDSLRSPLEREAAMRQYDPQMRRYAQAALDLLGEPARVRLCFLDDNGMVSLEEIR